MELLTPTDWFQKGHDIRGWKRQPGEPIQRPLLEAGVYGRFPASVADVAIEQSRIARINDKSRLTSSCVRACCARCGSSSSTKIAT
jgi:hypothetical protein